MYSLLTLFLATLEVLYSKVSMIFRYSSGGEDGYVRVHNFDSQYFDFEFEY